MTFPTIKSSRWEFSWKSNEGFWELEPAKGTALDSNRPGYRLAGQNPFNGIGLPVVDSIRSF